MAAYRHSIIRSSVVAAASATLILAGCSASGGHHASSSTSTSSTSSVSTTPPSSAASTLEAVRTALGQVLADDRGHTVYTFAHDKTQVSTCTGACATMWPPVVVNAGSPLHAPVVSGVLGTSTRPGGEVQATWNGHPLYTYSGDTAAGQTRGQGIKGLWSVVTIAAHPTTATTHRASTPVTPATTRRPTSSTPTTRKSSAPHPTKPPSSSRSTSMPPPTSCIPQGGGGDGDGDNFGGPTDGDGCT